jgi:competence protein ComGB
MLGNGFSLYDCIQLFKTSTNPFEQKISKTLENTVIAGKELSAYLENLGYSQKIVLQIEFAETHGNLLSTLQSIDSSLTKLEKEREKIISILTYPCLLFIFIIGILFIMRNFLLPELQQRLGYQENIGLRLIKFGPMIVLIFFVFSIILFLLIQRQLSKKTSLKKAEIFSKFPFIGHFYQLQITSYLSREWGRFFEQGMELHEILIIMQSLEKKSLLKDLSKKLENGLQQGFSFSSQMKQIHFVLEEFGTIIQQAEINFQLGSELVSYGDLCAKRLLKKIETKMHLIQPIIFLFIGGMILLIYISMLLPMYQNIGGLTQ